MDALRIALVDDHELFRLGIRTTLRESDTLTLHVAYEAESGAAFFALLEKETPPDIVLLDIMLPDISGVEIARRLKKNYPAVKIIILSSEVSEELITELLDIGVDGYMSKLGRQEDLLRAIGTVYQGNPYYGHSVSKMMYDIYLRQRYMPEQPKQKKRFFCRKNQETRVFNTPLSEKEIMVLTLLGDGLSIKEIAAEMKVSPRTVDTHKSTILNKLGFTRSVDLIKYAIREGIVKL
ncbi:response regulator transcription factor [Tannerella sp.]|uniref:response regulator transcription factor n=1 Tax=Tannerella sp. TaxID=2382127 RepID=UPI0026DAEB88|nr:response regulator transcription factor [Tannerella sp.]MDO4704350.1 response regulator transcription factor [Tannerella sp.]